MIDFPTGPIARASHRAAVVCVVCLAWFVSRPCAAAELLVSLRFQSNAPSCGDQTAFRAAVRQRDARIRWSDQGSIRLDVRVVLGERGRYEGSLRVLDEDGSGNTRRVDGKCKEVVDALALFAAMTVHAQAEQFEPEKPTKPRPPEPPTTTAPKTPTRPGPSASEAVTTPETKMDGSSPATKPPASDADGKPTGGPAKASAKRPATAGVPPVPKDAGPTTDEEKSPDATRSKPPTAPPTPRTFRPSEGWRWGVGVYAGTANSLDEGFEFILPVFVSLEKHGPQLLSPAFRLGIITTVPADASLAVGEARLTRVTGRLEGCPLRLRWFKRWSLLPCAGFEAGVIAAQSSGLDENTDAISGWAAADGTLRLGVDLTSWLAVQVQGGLGGVVQRPRYFVEGASADVSLQLASLYGTLGSGLHLQFR